MIMKIIYARTVFFLGWLVLTIAATHAIAGFDATQSAYPHFSLAAAR